MGNVCSPSFSCDATLPQCLDCTVTKAGYLRHLQDNLKAMERELKRLIEVRNDVRVRVIVAEQQQMKQLEQVRGWFSRVHDVEEEVQKLIRKSPRETEKLCLGGFCSKNCMSSYKFGKKVIKAVRDVHSLRNEGNFKEVAQPVPVNPVDERPVPTSVVGLQLTFDRVWSCLMEEQTGIVGLYGMGGVGKTTLLTQINNQFIGTQNNFDFVIWMVVSKDLQLEKIQESIAKKISLFNESWNSKNLQEKAQEIFKSTSNKKFVILLDDLWEPVDLAQVGLPVPNHRSGSKVIFTTREFDVCGQMEAHKSFKVECLRDEDAWKLFEEKVGIDTLDSHPNIPELAVTVAKECGGLPLALITVGRAMASRKTPREWEHAIEVLRVSASQFTGMEKRVFSRLKFSYDFLPNDVSRFCLLYCSLFPEDYRISIEDLIDCWICEGVLDEYDGIGARNQAYSVIRTLLRACLLEEDDNYVKMHDVIRDMTLWIGSTMDKEKEKFLVLAGVGLTQVPRIEMWKEITRMSLMQNKINNLQESPECPRLQTLFLSSNKLRGVKSEFFQSMAFLTVLKLSNSYPPQDLLFGISSLVSLQHLDLSMTEIRSIPIELKCLVNLKCLNLEYTFLLSRIPPQVLSNLKMLQSLRMYHCGLDVEQETESILFGGSEVLVEELIGLKNLNVLTITLHSFRALQILLSSSRLQSTSTPSLCLRKCNKSKSLSVFSLASLRHLQTLYLENCEDLKELKIDYRREVKKFRDAHCFCSLQTVDISGLRLRHVTWLIFAPTLKHLRIRRCQDLIEIISVDKLGEVPAEVLGNLIPFARLEYLTLEVLFNLKSIHSGALPFPHLKEMGVHDCPELNKLPLDCNSGLERKIIIMGDECWWNKLQWDDQASQNAFLPCFIHIPGNVRVPSDWV